jgi:hypothetical protein
MNLCHLPERGVLRIDGPDARKLLDGVLTCDVASIAPGRAGYGALLSPQGKILCDLLLVELPEAEGGGFLADVPVMLAGALVQRLTLYRLRAKVTFTDLSERAAVAVSVAGAAIPEEAGIVFDDPRLPALGPRVVLDRAEIVRWCGAEGTTEAWEAWHARRIALGLPDGGKDFAYGDALPHEALMDQLGGVDFRKGCYVGQEVVSRMEHRGTARTRLVPVAFDHGFTPLSGVEVRAGERRLGQLGSAAAGRGLAMLRLDRVADALAAGEPIAAGGLGLRLVRPDFARFAFPGEPGFGQPREDQG